MTADRLPAIPLRGFATLAPALGLSAIVVAVAHAVPPPPPPPEVLARIQADCRSAPRERIPIAKDAVPPPRAPARLNLSWAIRLTPPPGERLGRVIGLTSTWSGSILAATDRGYWIRVPSARDEALEQPSVPVAVSIRDLPGAPEQMGFEGWSGEPGYVGLNVVVAVPGQPNLLSYEIGGCFPGARPTPGPAIPPGQRIFRLEPAADSAGQILFRAADGSLGARPFLVVGPPRAGPETVTRLVRDATASARIPLAEGCDELTFERREAETLISTGCSQNYLSGLAEMWARPQRQHRQPLPISEPRIVGQIESPVVAVSDARYLLPNLRSALGPVPRGDRSVPGVRCAILLAAQQAADAPIFIFGAQPYCAYYPRDPSGAPFPPPPPP